MIVAHPAHARRRRAPVLQLDALAQTAQGVGRGHPLDLGQVLLLHAEGGMGQTVGQPAVVGEQQETLCVGVEAPDREDPGHPGHESHGRGPALGVGGGGDHASGLVEQVVDGAGRGAQGVAVDLHPVALGVDPLAQQGHGAVDPHPARLDELLTGPPTAHAAAGQHLLEALPRPPLTGGLGRHPSAGRSPCSSASMASGPGTKSPSGGRSSTVSRPSRSRNTGVVPNRTACPGPGSRATWPM